MTFQPSSGETPTADGGRSRHALVIATFFFVGYVPRAPGTIASLLTCSIWVLPIFLGSTLIQRVLVSLLIFGVGVWAANRSLAAFKEHSDPGAIVIDEVAGQTLALASCQNFLSLVAAFLLFRIFDILKPGPIGWLDRKIKGGLGIMIDDMAAGLCALGVLLLSHYFWPNVF